MKEPVLPVTLHSKLKYVSIDIETTGLDPEYLPDSRNRGGLDRMDEAHRPVAGLSPTGLPQGIPWQRLRLGDDGQPLAAPIRPTGALVRDPDQVADDFAAWLKGCGWDGQTGVTPAGKNFASFDRQFLKRLPRFEQVVKLSHRTLDPAVLFWHTLADEKLPDSKTCYERAGLDNKVAHTAVEDALAVVRLVRMGIKRLKGKCNMTDDIRASLARRRRSHHQPGRRQRGIDHPLDRPPQGDRVP